jgi:hypothetical protein
MQMFHALAKHGGMSLTLKCKGDLWIDDHHSADRFPDRCTRHHLMALHRIVLWLLARHSRPPWAKYAASDAMEQDLLPWTRYIFPLNRSHSLIRPGALSSSHRYLLKAVLCYRSRVKARKDWRSFHRNDPTRIPFIRHGCWRYPSCRCPSRRE